MGGAIVFPGGKLDAPTRRRVDALMTPARLPARADALHDRRRALPRARHRRVPRDARGGGDPPVADGTLTQDDALSRSARGSTRRPSALRAFLVARAACASISPRSTRSRAGSRPRRSRAASTRASSSPSRRDGQPGAHDEHETMASFWARPRRGARALRRAARSSSRRRRIAPRDPRRSAKTSTQRGRSSPSGRAPRPHLPAARRTHATGTRLALVLPGRSRARPRSERASRESRATSCAASAGSPRIRRRDELGASCAPGNVLIVPRGTPSPR